MPVKFLYETMLLQTHGRHDRGSLCDDLGVARQLSSHARLLLGGFRIFLALLLQPSRLLRLQISQRLPLW